MQYALHIAYYTLYVHYKYTVYITQHRTQQDSLQWLNPSNQSPAQSTPMTAPLHRVEERFDQVEESFRRQRAGGQCRLQCSTVSCTVYWCRAMLDTQGSNAVSQEWLNDKAASAGPCFQCKILFSNGLSRVKDGDKLCARVEVVAHQVGQLLVRVRLHLLPMIMLPIYSTTSIIELLESQ